MDIRSFQLNFEVNATIYSERTARKLEEAFENDTLLCEEVTEESYVRRNLIIRIKNNIQIISPLYRNI